MEMSLVLKNKHGNEVGRQARQPKKEGEIMLPIEMFDKTYYYVGVQDESIVYVEGNPDDHVCADEVVDEVVDG